MTEAFDLRHLDLSDRDGVRGIGRFNVHNVLVALRHAARALGIVLRHRPEILYVPIDRGLWGFMRDMAIMLPARLCGVKVVAHLRAGRFDLIHDFGATGRLVARIGLSWIDRVLVLGESLRGIFGAFVPPDRVHVVPNGIDLDSWHRVEPCARGATATIAYLGNLFEDKGAHVVLEALPGIIRRVGDVIVEFAGDWISDDYRRRCLALVDDLGIESHVRFVGRVDDRGKRELLHRADVLVFVPVRAEGSPWVVLEAMASGLPVVGTPQGTMIETIVDGVTGYLVEPAQTDTLTDRVSRLLVDEQLREAMGQAARRRIEQVFCEEKTLECLIDALHVTTGRGRKGNDTMRLVVASTESRTNQTSSQEVATW